MPTHLENMKRKIIYSYCGQALPPTHLEQAQLIIYLEKRQLFWKIVKDKINEIA